METPASPPQKPKDHIVLKLTRTQFTVIFIFMLMIILGAVAHILHPEKDQAKTQLPSPNANWHLIHNGNFENDEIGPQQLDHQKGRFTRSTDIAYEGMYSAKTIITQHNEAFAQITDMIQVEPGKSYTLSAFFNTQNFPTGNLSIDLADTHEFRLNATPNQGWHFKYAQFTAHSTTVRIRLICDGPTRSTHAGYIDCVALTPTTEFKP